MPSVVATVRPEEFARVINCARCDPERFRKLLRDRRENLPQPGYVGARYAERRVLLVGQNPGVGRAFRTVMDARYIECLRRLGNDPNEEALRSLAVVLEEFVPQWPLHGRHFPLEECRLELDQIAYFNLVRCRTKENATPGVGLRNTCVSAHFERWLDLLTPAVVVFLGKWAFQQAGPLLDRRGTPHVFINRDRSLNSERRTANRADVAGLVRSVTGASAESL